MTNNHWSDVVSIMNSTSRFLLLLFFVYFFSDVQYGVFLQIAIQIQCISLLVLQTGENH